MTSTTRAVLAAIVVATGCVHGLQLHTQALQKLSQPELAPCHSELQPSAELNHQVGRRGMLGITAAAAVGISAGPANADTEVKKFLKTESGVKYFDLKEGKGYSPFPGQIVVLKYKAFLSNGQMFDSSSGPGRKALVATYKASPPQMLKGWEDVIGDMKEGGTRVLQVPPELAYGEKGVCIGDGECLVPPNERLQFELTLERVVLPPP